MTEMDEARAAGIEFRSPVRGVGDDVHHPSFGSGVVIRYDANHITVRFGHVDFPANGDFGGFYRMVTGVGGVVLHSRLGVGVVAACDNNHVVVRFGRSDLPTHDSYVMAHRCRRCKAAPGEPCNYKRRTLAALDTDPSVRVHVTRSDAGTRHFYRDLGKAPWPEAREPGKRYDTLPR